MNSLPPAIRRFGDVALEARTQPPRGIAPRPMRIRLWLPLTPLFLLLAPIVLLLSPLGYLAPPRWRADPILTVLALGGLLLSLGGTEVDVDCADAVIRIKIF